MAIHSSLGASRWQLFRYLLCECLMLSAAGGGLGLLAASWALDLDCKLHAQSSQLQVFDFRMDYRVVGFTAMVSVACALIFGLVPAWRSSRVNLNEELKQGDRRVSRGVPHHRTSQLLVVGQVTLSLILLAAAGVAINSMLRIWEFNWGFRLDRMVALSLALPEGRFPSNNQRVAYFERLSQQVKALPGVVSVTLTNRLPIGFSSHYVNFRIAGQPQSPSPDGLPSAALRLVSPGYFQTFAVQLQKGQLFTSRESAQQAQVALINQTMADRFWGEQDPLGSQIQIGGAGYTIIGVTWDSSIRNPIETPPPEITLPYTLACPAGMNVIVESVGAGSGLAQELRTIVERSDLEPPLFSLQTMEQVRSEFLIVPGFVVTLLMVFASMAVALAGVGVFGVISHFTAQRTQEIGVRMALGARRRDVLWMVLRRGLALLLIGIGLGSFGGLAVTRVLLSQVHWLKANVPVTLELVTLFLLLTGFVACLAPARRAAKLDPMVALRFE